MAALAICASEKYSLQDSPSYVFLQASHCLEGHAVVFPTEMKGGDKTVFLEKSYKQRAAPLLHVGHQSIFLKRAVGIQCVFWALAKFGVQTPTANTHGYDISLKGITTLCRHLTGLDVECNSPLRNPCA